MGLQLEYLKKVIIACVTESDLILKTNKYTMFGYFDYMLIVFSLYFYSPSGDLYAKLTKIMANWAIFCIRKWKDELRQNISVGLKIGGMEDFNFCLESKSKTTQFGYKMRVSR